MAGHGIGTELRMSPGLFDSALDSVRVGDRGDKSHLVIKRRTLKKQTLGSGALYSQRTNHLLSS